MGIFICIEINKKWKEFVLLWFVIVFKKGINKLGVFNLLLGVLQEIEEMLAESYDDNNEEEI